MAQNQNKTIVGSGTWTLLTNSDIASCTLQNQNGYAIVLQATVGTTAPAGLDGLSFPALMGERNVALVDLLPGVAGANRLWARNTRAGSCQVFISHA